MQFCNLNRTDFASLLSEGGAISSLPMPPRMGQPGFPPEAHGLWVCWDDKTPASGNSLPALVIVSDEDLTDFFAWAVTFLPAFRPLTSFLRVLPWTVFSLAKARERTTAPSLNAALVGGILGEKLTNATGRGFIESLPLTAFESTYSYAMSRTLLTGLNPKILQYVSDGWHNAREFTEQRTRRIPPDALESVWSVVLRLAGERQTQPSQAATKDQVTLVVEACLEIRDGGNISSFNWHRLSGGLINNSAVADTMNSTKEHRVDAFEHMVKILSKNVSDELSTGFLVGYLASLVSDGSLEHSQLIFPLQERLPTAMLWYGICAGLLPKSHILNDYAHLGLRILRSLNREDNLLSTPGCDLSLPELEVLLRGDQRSINFRQTHASFLRVELAPMVTTVLRWPGRQGASGQLGLFSGDERQTPAEMDRLRELVTTLRSSLSLAESLLGGQAGTTIAASRKRRR
jgi:hypothetical protein